MGSSQPSASRQAAVPQLSAASLVLKLTCMEFLQMSKSSVAVGYEEAPSSGVLVDRGGLQMGVIFT